MGFNLLLVGFTIALAILDLVVFIFIVINYRQSKGLWQVGLIFILEFFYGLGYGLELIATDLNIKILFNHIQYLGIPFIVVVWFYITKIFENPRFVMPIKQMILISAIPILVMLSVQLYPWVNGVYYANGFIDIANASSNLGLAVLVFTKGPLYYVGVVYTAVLIGAVTYTYYKVWKAKKGYRSKEAFWLTVLSAISLLTVVPTFFSRQTSGIDFSLYFLQFIAYIVLFTMFKYETIDLKPSAHRATFETSSDPMVIVDDVYDVISWNHAFTHFIEKPVVYRTNISDFTTNKELIDSIKTQKAYGFTFHDRHFILETSDVRNHAGHKNGYLIRFNDMTSYIERIAVLDYEATHDELTNIFNRRAFIDQMEKYLVDKENQYEPFALVMLDIDDFKKINDTYGHVVGDCILEEMCSVIRKELPDKVMFARYGGEEFMIHFRNIADDVVCAISDHVRQIVADHLFRVQEHELHIQVSVGISINRTGDNVTLREYINKTDEAMYMSKKAGKNRCTSIR